MVTSISRTSGRHLLWRTGLIWHMLIRVLSMGMQMEMVVPQMVVARMATAETKTVAMGIVAMAVAMTATAATRTALMATAVTGAAPMAANAQSRPSKKKSWTK